MKGFIRVGTRIVHHIYLQSLRQPAIKEDLYRYRASLFFYPQSAYGLLSRGILLFLCTFGMLAVFVNVGRAAPLPAFPGAEGYGAIAVGGRGGQVIEVTNLNDSGPGSLRAAIEATGPRTVVFRVAGEIILPTSWSTIKIRNPYITIAGQTAPGDGITIRSASGDAGPPIALTDGVHDVVIRYIKLRYGKGNKNADNLTVRDASRVIIDHVSAQWASDESISITPSTSGWNTADVTIQRSIIAETLEPHSTGTLITRYGENDQKTERISVHHNLYAHNNYRNPAISAHLEVTTPPEVQVINNLVYNWGNRVGSTKGGAKVDFIGNYWKAGPMSNVDNIYLHEHAKYDDPTMIFPDPSIFIETNIASPKYPDPNEDNWQLYQYHYHLTGPLPLAWRRHTPLTSTIPIIVQPPQEAYTSILDDVGCNGRLAADGSWVKNIDVVDQAILNDVVNGTGPTLESEMDHHNDFGGYPPINPGTPYDDTDHDGMPDTWETNNGFNPQDPSDGPEDADGDGYTNLEEFLNNTDSGASLPAFPGAEGYGAVAVGGRGGQVIEVTNLNDSGPGSLRAAIEATGPRTVVFRVAGEIILPTSWSTIKIRNPYITIAGQTAPGDGITIRSASGDAGPPIALTDGVHDVVIRYIKLRYGKGNKNADNLTVRDASRVIIDHVSAQWASDESISITPSTSGWNTADVTIQRSIIAETLEPHSTGTLITRYGENDQKTERISVHHNLYAHNNYRNPAISAHLEVTTPPEVQVINNLVYNWGNRVGSTKGGAKVDFIGNYWKAGPMSNVDNIYLHEHAKYDDPTMIFPDPSIFIETNIASPKYPDPNEDNWQLYQYHYHLTGPLPLAWRRHTPLTSTIPIIVQPPQEAYTSILDDVGCNGRLAADGSWVKNIDVVDQAILNDVVNGTGPTLESEMDHHNDFGGYPPINPGTPYDDTDHDGMPDTWETNNGFNPQDPSDGPEDADGDGYTNLEEFLNNTVLGALLPPSNLRVQIASPFEITLEWDASSGMVDGYKVFVRQHSEDFKYDYPEWQGTTTTCTIYGLVEGFNYYLVARAFNDSGESEDSNEVKEAVIGVSGFETGQYETTGKGKNKTQAFVLTDTFAAGDTVVIRMYIADVNTGLPVANSTTDVAISGPEGTRLISDPSGSDGIAEARWETSGHKGKGKKANSTTPGIYEATVTNVTVTNVTGDHNIWDGNDTWTTFVIQ